MELLSQAENLLHRLCDSTGIRASLSEEGNYRAVFTRDAVMAGIYGLLAKDEIVISGLISSLTELRKLQGRQGQIASNYTYVGNELQSVSYGTLCMKMDALTWYLLGLSMSVSEGYLERREWAESAERTIDLLEALEYNGRHLLYVPAGGNWADEYPYEGYVLFDQALRAWAMARAAKAFDRPDWHVKSTAILDTINLNFWPEIQHSDRVIQPRIFRRWAKSQPGNHYAASFTPTGYTLEFDLAANTLMSIIQDGGDADRALEYALHQFLSESKMPPAFHPTINPGEPLWDRLRQFYIYVFKNDPGHYHNGGIWPIWIGWLSLALQRRGRMEEAGKLGSILLQTVKEAGGEFDFQEYFDGTHLKPGGTSGMAYTATGILMTALGGEASRKL